MAIRTLCVFVLLASCAVAQEVVPLYPGTPPGSTPESYPEKEYFSKLWNTEVVSNVTKPSLTVFKPAPEKKNGTAAVICPGGGFMALSITSEGTDVAKYLTERGVTTFVLKYRLAHSGEDATQEFADLFKDREKFRETIGKVIPLSVADGRATLIAGVNGKALDRVKAGELLAHIAAQIGGKGGGRADLAQGGGADGPMLVAALDGVRGWVEERVA